MPESTLPAQAGPDAYFLHAAAASIDAGEQPNVAGQPARAFYSKAIRIGGKYVHPVKGFELSATPSRAEHWLSAFASMQDRGVRVPVVLDHQVKAASTMGHVLSLDRDGEWLRVKFLAIGDDAIRTAARNEVSLGIDPAFKDGLGNRYDEAITHLALTPIPVVPGQGGLLAASRDGDATNKPDVFLLSLDPKRGDTAAGVDPMPIDTTLRARLVAATGADATCADELLLSRAADELEKQQKDIETLHESYLLSREAVDKAGTELATVRTDLQELQKMNLSRDGGANQPDPEVLLERGLRVGEKFDRLVANGYTPADVKRLKSIVLGDATSPNVFALSRDAGQADCAAALIAEVLLEARPGPRPGEQTRQPLDRAAVRMNLSRQDDEKEAGNPLLETAQQMYPKRTA